MSLSQDVVHSIINIQWGGEFVAGFNEAITGETRTGMIKRYGGDGWITTGTITSSHINEISAGAFGERVARDAGGTITGLEPVFVIGGSYHDLFANPDVSSGFTSFIMTSFDSGQTWAVTHTQEEAYVYVMGFNQNTRTFYAQCAADLQPGGFGVGPFGNATIRVLASQTGSSWRTDEIRWYQEYYASPKLEATGNPLNKDVFDKIIPNGGIYAEDKERQIIITPMDLTPYFTGRFANPKNTVEIITKHPETGATIRTTKTLPMDQVHCVAYASGTWKAGGESGFPDKIAVVASSTNDGASWTVDYTIPSNSETACMMGLSLSTV